MMSPNSIDQFFSSPSFGVVGASSDPAKYGNRVLRAYLKHQLTAYPINPNCSDIDGLRCLASVKDLPDQTKSLSIITPPSVTEQIVREAAEKGIQNVWMQPGAESEAAVRLAQEHGMNVIADGSCVMVMLAQR